MDVSAARTDPDLLLQDGCQFVQECLFAECVDLEEHRLRTA